MRVDGSYVGPLTVAQVANCVMWSVYGVAVSDLWVWGPNFVGFGLGLVQLSLLMLCPSQPTADPKFSSLSQVLPQVLGTQDDKFV